ncbi:MAG: (d)CMP kinase [Ignavibacteria bacterium]|nr:(d)CMP kinase [Ignavibacteria bacterium]MBT8382665.1 (d)CMP kinase [Ignavibacteria bacterium]MBT8391220.1 (d)CMP kinase [Ignavibacteria bacterium]NNJ54433.1 (d)CMP kinase [Ignavibacteriaceae bacterium]NNL22447.1 (d)CMP kinase [Ignavibacteriaceae bacterium]
MLKGLIIAIDGPAGSGKSTSAKLLAQKLGYLYIDTGAMYRAVTYLAIENNALGNDEQIVELARVCDLEMNYKNTKLSVKLNGKDVSSRIRETDVNEQVSDVSKIGALRKLLVEKQRSIAEKSSGVVMEGRDITTVVFPNADVKIFLTANLNERANRRTKEYVEHGSMASVNQIKNNLATRDKIDSSRDDSPLTKANDAIVIDTTSITIEDQVSLILNKAKSAAREKGIELKVY